MHVSRCRLDQGAGPGSWTRELDQLGSWTRELGPTAACPWEENADVVENNGSRESSDHRSNIWVGRSCIGERHFSEVAINPCDTQGYSNQLT